MSILLENDKLVVRDEPGILNENLNKIELLNRDALFLHPFTNKIGRQLVYYMANSSYHNLSNPEPVNLSKNTLSVKLRVLAKIDEYIQKPLNEYTYQDFNQFISSFKNGSIKSSSNKVLKPQAINGYVIQFKRFWRIYRQYVISNYPEEFNEAFFDWGMNLKAPKVDSREYEDIPDLNMYQIKALSDNMGSFEHRCRVLVSINLMGRKCEIHNLKMRHITKKEDGSIWIKLPKIKKHSSEKTYVQLYNHVANPFLDYLKQNNFGEDDSVFPTTDPAFAKHLKIVSKKVLKTPITIKMLRKIGVSVAEELGYSRADVERIGGWSANSPVVNHYFNRKKGVPAKNNEKVEQELNKDLYFDLEKERHMRMSAENRLEGSLKHVFERLDGFESKFNQLLNQMSLSAEERADKMISESHSQHKKDMLALKELFDKVTSSE